MSSQSVQGFVEGHHYSRAEIGAVVGGDTQQIYLPKKKGGPITCAILKEETNLAPPDVILVGIKDRIKKRAAQLCEERGPIPTFVDEGSGPRYCGRYEVTHSTEDPDRLARWATVSGRDGLSRVIFMKKVKLN